MHSKEANTTCSYLIEKPLELYSEVCRNISRIDWWNRSGLWVAAHLSAAPSPLRVTKAYCLSKEQVLISPYGANSLLSSSWVASKGRFPTNNFTLSPLISVSANHLRTGQAKNRRLRLVWMTLSVQLTWEYQMGLVQNRSYSFTVYLS